MVTEKPLILVVDDESDSLAYLFDLLHNEGYRVLPTPNPFQALELVTKKKPQVVISDLRMPDLDGLELLDRIKAASPKTRVILITAYGDRAMRRVIQAKGGEEMLPKPSPNADILKAVRNALEKGEACFT